MQLNRVKEIYNHIKIERVLISVANKTLLEKLVKELLKINQDIQIYSTGGTYNAIETYLTNERLENLHKISDYTGQPEMQGGLVKTLDFKIYLGLLSESFNNYHAKDLERTQSKTFDMVVANLYPFKKAIEEDNASIEDARTHIDIGGPSMLRAAAKNFLRVASVCDFNDYDYILKTIKENNGFLSLENRYQLAKKVFKLTAKYDSEISDFFENNTCTGAYNVR